MSRLVRGERDRALLAALGATVGVRPFEQPRVDERLEAVAHAQHEAATRHEGRELATKERAQLVAEDAPGRDVVAVAEATGQNEDARRVEPRGLSAELVQVQELGGRAAALEGELGLVLAVGARCAQDDRVGTHPWNPP